MIVKSEEVAVLDRAFKSLEGAAALHFGLHAWHSFLEMPHLISIGVFDEYRGFVSGSALTQLHGTTKWWVFEDSIPQGTFRDPSGSWWFLKTVGGDGLTFQNLGNGRQLHQDRETLISQATKAHALGVIETSRVFCSALWTPGAQEQNRINLQDNTVHLLQQLRSHAICLADVSWKDLENIVAEVLRAKGLDIHKVEERPQGGRDIIARGELVPGEEPITIAIEVKHRPVVGIDDV